MAITAPHWECGIVRSDDRSFRLEKHNGIAGLATGCIKLPFCPHRKARGWLGEAFGSASADPLRRPGGWRLHLIVDIPPPESVPDGRVVGAGPGPNRPAVTSDAVPRKGTVEGD
ncbi:MAG: hypothetical protein J2P48_13805 [Alphaproteobacteria bacterium]|nr:hypothetical protein [Alphaproteobacteria bacterium]